MTMVDVGYQTFPSGKYLPQNGNNAFGSPTATFDSTSDRLAFLFIAPKAITLTDIWFLTGTVTSGASVNVRVETVSNGRPSGTLWATNTSGTVTVSGATTWQACTLTASATIAAGNQVAIVITDDSLDAGTHNGQYWSGLSNALMSPVFPCWLQDTGGGSWAHVQASPYLILGNSGTPTVIPGALPFSSVSNTGFDSNDTPDEYALRFVSPVKQRCAGAMVSLGNISAGADFKVFLWADGGTADVDGTALGVATIDGDMSPSTTTEGFWEVYWATPVTLTAGATYRIGVRAETTTANGVGVIVFNMAGTSIPTGYINASPFGADCYLQTRAWVAGAAGAWASDTAKIPNFRAIIDQLDDGTGTGSGGSFGRMIGG